MTTGFDTTHRVGSVLSHPGLREIPVTLVNADVHKVTTTPLFTPTPDVPVRIPGWVWTSARMVVLVAALALIAGALIYPQAGLPAFWSVFIPSAPLLFMVAPGLWRNLCPMATLNQVPRVLGFSAGRTVPARLRAKAPWISAGLFLCLVLLRPLGLEQSPRATAMFLTGVLALALAGGVMFKGKSGWCTAFCPMLTVERFYNAAPFALVRNSHCQPCVGCTSNCYDYNPTASLIAEMHDQESQVGHVRGLVAGVMPWLIVGFFTHPDLTPGNVDGAAGFIGRMLVLVVAGAGLFTIVEAVLPLSRFTLALLHAAVALNLFYAFVLPRTVGNVPEVGGVLAFTAEVLVGAISVLWLIRALPRERKHREAVAVEAVATPSVTGGSASVTFAGSPTVSAAPGQTLLAVAEANGIPIQSGCRAGSCGADVVYVTEGADNLSPCAGHERSTLDRLDLPDHCRLACVARVRGPVEVSLAASGPAAAGAASDGPTVIEVAPALVPFAPSASTLEAVRRVVVVGNGAAGVAVCDELRKLAPDTQITLLGTEAYRPYDRTLIGKVLAETMAIDKLYMVSPTWGASRGIRHVTGLSAAMVDRAAREVITEVGDRLPYDRLVLATGAGSRRPPVEGFGMRGSFVLRSLDDAVDLQQHVRRRRCRNAVVIGGGFLGLEAAYELTRIGIPVFVVHNAAWPLNRQLDAESGELLRRQMKDLGIEVLAETQAVRLLGGHADGSGWVEAIELSDGRTIPVDACLAAVGMSPNTELARAAGLKVGQGIVVDDRLATSDPDIYACGDVIERDGRLFGLINACREQAAIVARNLVGADIAYDGVMPASQLKIPEVSVFSVGAISPPKGDEECFAIRLAEAGGRYRKLLVSRGRVVGGILVGHTEMRDALSAAVRTHLDVSAHLSPLLAGDWSVLQRGADQPLARAPQPVPAPAPQVAGSAEPRAGGNPPPAPAAQPAFAIAPVEDTAERPVVHVYEPMVSPAIPAAQRELTFVALAPSPDSLRLNADLIRRSMHT